MTIFNVKTLKNMEVSSYK